MDFLNSNPPPKFTGSIGMSVEDFTKAMDDYGAATTAYAHQITLFSIKKSDCPGTPIPASGLADLGLAATFCTEQAGP
jgi:hypothetical protein